jgi:hypothetical protein
MVTSGIAINKRENLEVNLFMPLSGNPSNATDRKVAPTKPIIGHE